jgi:transmembrane sensor
VADTGNDESIRAEARAWLLRQALDGIALKDSTEFQHWYQSSARHASAYEEIAQTWSDAAELQDLRHLVEPLGSETAASDAGSSWSIRALAAGVVLAIAVGLIAWVVQRPHLYETQVGEVREVRLPDGSVLTLGGKSLVAIRMADDRRDAELRAGEMFISVHPDKQRPFHVSVGETQVRVVGTQFNVRRGAAQVEIGVLEGVVEVQRTTEATNTKVLHAGQQLTANASGEMGEPQATGAMQPGGWRKGRRVYVDAPLREIVADANRYSRHQIQLADAQLGELKVSVSFRPENQQQMFNSLQLALPLRVERPEPNRIVLRAE